MRLHLLASDGEGPLTPSSPGMEAVSASMDERVINVIIELVSANPILANSLSAPMRRYVLSQLGERGISFPIDLTAVKLSPADLESALGMSFECVIPDVAAHTRSVAQRTISLAMEMGISGDHLRLVANGGLLHDVGKVDPDVHRLITQPRRLTPTEKTIVKMHPVIGEQVLRAFGVDPMICEMAGKHHERHDGTGYPSRMKTGEVSLEVAILTVTDAVDAVMADRPGRNGRGIETVLEFLEKGRGGHFNPDVVDAFRRTCGSVSA